MVVVLFCEGDEVDTGLEGRARLAPVCTVGHFLAGFFSGATGASPGLGGGSSSALPDNTNCPRFADTPAAMVSAVRMSHTGLVFPFLRPPFDSSNLDVDSAWLLSAVLSLSISVFFVGSCSCAVVVVIVIILLDDDDTIGSVSVVPPIPLNQDNGLGSMVGMVTAGTTDSGLNQKLLPSSLTGSGSSISAASCRDSTTGDCRGEGITIIGGDTI